MNNDWKMTQEDKKLIASNNPELFQAMLRKEQDIEYGGVDKILFALKIGMGLMITMPIIVIILVALS